LEPTLYYDNPNIHPYGEYLKRRETLEQLERDEQLQVVYSQEYNLREYLREALAAEEQGAAWRCRACYLLRLTATARYAKAHGYRSISTSLLISPYQQHDLIAALGRDAAAAYDLSFAYADLRPGFRESQSEARSRGYYRQRYCGCIFSEMEIRR